jgi:hypothetical protein
MENKKKQLRRSNNLHFSILHNECHMTLWTDHHHLNSGKVLHTGSAEGLPSGTALQFDRITQLVLREYVLMGIEKDLFL